MERTATLGTHVREHTSVLADAEKRLLVRMARRMPAARQLRPSDGARRLGDGGRRRRLCRRQRGPPCALSRAGAAGGELVRRQPGRHGGPRPRPPAAAVRLLPRPRGGPRHHHRALRRHGDLRADAADAGDAGAARLRPAVRRVVPGHAYRGRLPPGVLGNGPHRAADPAGGWRAGGHHAAHRRRWLGLRELPLFDIGGWVAVVGMGVVFVLSACRNARALYLAEPIPGSGR